MVYTIDGKQGRSVGVDAINTFSITASGVVTLIPTSSGRRDYIKILNNGAAPVKLYSSTVSGTVGFLVANSGGTFEDDTNAPIYIASTGADSVVNIYERKNK